MEQRDSSIYLFFRPFFKFVLHLLTGRTEIQRLARQHDIASLEKSIVLSKVLINYRTTHCKWDCPFQQDYADELCAIKHITDNDAKFRVRVALRQLHSWKYAINEIEAIRAVKYDSVSQVHEQCLFQIWEKLRPGRVIKGRKSTEWIELGFQGEDPATDFRGAGVLGLMNLVGWVRKQSGRQAFKVADTPGTDYFFASASLFLTMLSVQLVKEMRIGTDYWVLGEGQTVEGKFQLVFEAVGGEFAAFWGGVGDKSMMQFNVNLLGFARLARGGLLLKINERIRRNQ